MRLDRKTRVSKYLSYILRHNPEDLKMNGEGFVEFAEVLMKVRERYPFADGRLLTEIIEENERKRFEVVGGRIRALYGHTMNVRVELEEDRNISTLYHGTTPQASERIVKEGLKPMGRRWVHLSPTVELAREVGSRRADNPAILQINAFEARKNGVRFYVATDKVYVCKHVPAKYVKRLLA